MPKPLIGRETRVGPVPQRLFPIFRDREELPTTSDLSHAIDDALRDSLFLIVMCSPAAAKSRWVNEEIRAFKHLHGEDQVLAIIIGGEPNATDKGAPEEECFPEALRFRVGPDGALTTERTEPIAADARAQGDGKDDALLKLLSGLLAVNFNDLKQREVQAARRRARIAQGVAGVMGVLAIAALGAGWIAYQNQQIAEEQRAVAVEQRRIAEAETRRADAQREVAEAQKRIAEARLREALIERAGRTIADSRAAATDGAANQALALAGSALGAALEIDEPPLINQAAQLARDLLMEDRLETALEGRYPRALTLPRFSRIEASPDGAVIMALRGDRLLLWDRLTGARLQRITGVEAAAFRPDGGVGGILDGGEVFAIAPKTGAASLVRALTGPDGAFLLVRHAAISPDGSHAAVVSTDDAMMIVDMASGVTSHMLSLDAGGIRDLTWSADGRHLASSDFDPPRARIWAAETARLVVDQAPGGAVNSIRLGADKAVIHTDDGVRLVNLTTGEMTTLPDDERIDDVKIGADDEVVIDHALGPPQVLGPEGEAARTLGASTAYGLVGVRADGRQVVVRGARQFAVHDIRDGTLIHRVGRAGDAPAAFHMAPSGDYLAVLDESGLTTVWSLEDGREVLALRPPNGADWIGMLDAPMGALLVIVDGDGRVTLHRAEAAHLTTAGFGLVGAPVADGLIPVMGTYPAPTRLWDIATRRTVRTLPGPVMASDGPSGRIITRKGAALAITQIGEGRETTLAADIPRFVAATFASGDHVVIQTPDRIFLINTATGATVAEWPFVINQANPEQRAAFTPDGGKLVFLTGDHRLVVINVRQAAITNDVSLPWPARSITVASGGASVWIGRDDTASGARYDLANDALTPLPDGAALLFAGAHAAITGDGPRLRVMDAATGALRFERETRGDIYGAGAADNVIISHRIGDDDDGDSGFAGDDGSGRMRAEDAKTGAVLWEIATKLPFGATWRTPVLSLNEDWVLATAAGAGDVLLVDARAGRIAATLPKGARPPDRIHASAGLDALVLSDWSRGRVFDLSAAQADPQQLLAMLANRTRKTPPEAPDVTACDLAAAHADDPLAITSGRAVEDITLDAADLCQKALAAAPTGPSATRLTYQLSRALDAMGQSDQALQMLERLAARDYPMADHALGLWRLAGVGGDARDAVDHFRRAAAGGVGVSWVVLSRMADAGMIDDGDEDGLSVLNAGADAEAPDALRALALVAANDGRLQDAHRLAQRAVAAARPHRRPQFEALAVTLARRLRPGDNAGDDPDGR